MRLRYPLSACLLLLALVVTAGFWPIVAPGSAQSTGEPQLSADTTVYLPMTTSQSRGGIPPGGSIETFDGEPSSPLRWTPSDWDVAVHVRSPVRVMDSMQAQHGADCGPPTTTHTVRQLDDAVYICRNHLMTAINSADYGMIYLTPNQLVDFSQGEAVIRFDMSTLRTSQRDWVDLWVSPYADNLQLPLDIQVDANGPPRNAIQIRMDFVRSTFYVTLYRNFRPTEIGGDNIYIGYEDFLTPDAARRDTFELRLSRTHLAFGMPDYDFWWVDESIPQLSWGQGVVQFGHHSYNPTKDCEGPCGPNTWHWDNMLIAPAVPFTMINGDRRITDGSNAATPVLFSRPAPANAHLRFSAYGQNIEISVDGGATWRPAQRQSQSPALTNTSHFQSYWTPIPAGVTSVRFRGSNSDSWMIRSPAIWAPPGS